MKRKKRVVNLQKARDAYDKMIANSRDPRVTNASFHRPGSVRKA